MLIMTKIELKDGNNLTSKITPFEDGLMDGNYTSPAWTVASGTWSAANAYLDATVAGTAEIHTAVSSSDLEGWFSYKMGDTSMGSNCLLVRFRYLSGGSEQTYLRIFRNQMMIQERYDDEWITLATNASASSTEDVWYDIYIKADGEDIEVWQGPKGGTMTEVFSTDSSQVESASRFAFVQYVGGDFQIDDVRIADGSKSTSTSMSHDDNNQLASSAVNNVTTSFKYDVLGRTISKYNAYHDADYVYRYDDKLYQVTSDFPGEQNVSFDYDGLGKLREWDNGTDYAWLRWDPSWDLINLSGEEEEDEVDDETIYYRDALKTYVGRGAEFTGSNPATGTWEYHTKDNLGSVRGKWDASKASVGQHEYTPFGQIYAYTGTPIGNTDRGYTGHMWSAESSLYFAPYRFYSPQSARWMKVDPAGMVDGANTYAYARANPVKFSDGTGLWAVKGCCGDKKVIKKQVKAACANLDNIITDSSLLKCIKKRCKNNKVVCRTTRFICRKGTLGFNWGVSPYLRSRKANLCIDIIKDEGYEHKYGDIVIHEWAHSCGWKHNKGKGVPGDSGKMPL